MNDVWQPYSWLYAKEKLVAAIETLATSGLPLKQKLAEVWIYHLIHIREENMPTPELWSRLEKLERRFVTKKDEHIGSARASMNACRRVTHEKIATEIWDIYLTTMRIVSSHESAARNA